MEDSELKDAVRTEQTAAELLELTTENQSLAKALQQVFPSDPTLCSDPLHSNPDVSGIRCYQTNSLRCSNLPPVD